LTRLEVKVDMYEKPEPYALGFKWQANGGVNIWNQNKAFKAKLQKCIRNVFKGPLRGLHEKIGIKVTVLFPCDYKATERPDLDNLVKSIIDAATGVIYPDDGQVTRICAYKRRGGGEGWKFRVRYTVL
jgi:Holliday junction resolvase RusA-like endonuclease